MPDAEIIAVGSEMLTSQRLDTNSLFIADLLNSLGVEVRRKSVVGDDRSLIAATLVQALDNASIAILTGGLGPTEDDLTRDAVAQALGRDLVFRQDLCDSIEERFRRRQRKMAEVNKRQAYLVDGAEVIPNPNGTAVGQWIESAGKIVMLLPGPPGELKPMFSEHCMPRLAALFPGQVIRTRFYRVTGMTESDLDQLIAPVYSKYANPLTTILAQPYDLQVHLRARCGSAADAERLLAEVGDPIEALLGDRIFSRNGDSLESVVGTLLRDRGATVAVAESITGGMVAERITTVTGSSNYFLGGFLTYSDAMKHKLLGVDQNLIERHTAVSEEVACAMAAGAKKISGADFTIATTGEAGPKSNTPSPPGTVYIGIAGQGGDVEARRLNLPGDRTRIRMFATQAALDLLRRKLLSLGLSEPAKS